MRSGLATLGVSLLALAACGTDPSADPTTATPQAAETTIATAGTAPTFEVATGAEDVVISLTNEGGFVPVGVAFTNVPVVLVAGDGRTVSAGPTTAVFPGPLLPNVQQRTITPAGLQSLLARAEELGLLADVEYARNDLIADAPTTVLEITADGTTYRHEAYALGIDEQPDPAREALGTYAAELTDLPAAVGSAELGPEGPYVADRYLIQAAPVDPTAIDTGEEPTIVAWPADAPERLVDAADCVEVPAAAVDPRFADADALTFFTEPDPDDGAEVTYQLSVVPRLPGRSC